MQISFKALESSIQKIQTISEVEFTIDFEDTKLVFRLLTPDEENESVDFGYLLINKRKFETGLASSSSTGNCVKTAILSYALVQIGGLDLRGQDFITTENGDVPKHEAVAELILKNWDSSWIIHLYMAWMSKSMTEGIRITSKVKIDLKSLDDLLEYHQNEVVRIKEKLENFSVDNVKQKLEREVEREDREAQQDEPPPLDLLPEHNSSFLSSDNPEASLRAEEQRQKILAQNAQQEAEKQKEAQRLAWEQFNREQESLVPEEPEPVRLAQPVPPPPLRPEAAPTLNRGVHRAVSSLAGAFDTNKRVLIREPEEYLDEPENPRNKR